MPLARRRRRRARNLECGRRQAVGTSWFGVFFLGVNDGGSRVLRAYTWRIAGTYDSAYANPTGPGAASEFGQASSGGATSVRPAQSICCLRQKAMKPLGRLGNESAHECTLE